MSKSPVSEQLKPLLDVQAIDLKLQDLDEKQRVWPRKIAAVEEERDTLDARRDTLVQRRTELQMEQDQLQLEAQEEMERVLTYEKHIREIKTNREYQALLREVGVSKKAKADAEDSAVRVMEEVEGLAEEIAKLDEDIAALNAQLEEYQGEFDAVRGELEAELENLKSERAGYIKDIPRPFMGRYDLVRKKMPNAVVHAEDGACTGCHRKLPPQLYNQVLRDEQLMACPYCHRILMPPAERLDPAGEDAATENAAKRA